MFITFLKSFNKRARCVDIISGTSQASLVWDGKCEKFQSKVHSRLCETRRRSLHVSPCTKTRLKLGKLLSRLLRFYLNAITSLRHLLFFNLREINIVYVIKIILYLDDSLFVPFCFSFDIFHSKLNV